MDGDGQLVYNQFRLYYHAKFSGLIWIFLNKKLDRCDNTEYEYKAMKKNCKDKLKNV